MVLEDGCREGTNAVNRKAFFTYQGHLHSLFCLLQGDSYRTIEPPTNK